VRQVSNQQSTMSKKTSATSTSSSGASRLSTYRNRSHADRDLADAIVLALAAGSYHLPGNTWWQDLRQYFSNNHPVFGLCCQHKLHPIGTAKRIIVLIGSMACGLAITNILYLYFLSTDQGVDGEFISFDFNANVTVAQKSLELSEVTFTNYQITLWTLGTAIHSIFDLSVWFLSACGCCQPGGSLQCLGRIRWLGNYIVLFAVVVTAATASFIVVLRATLDDNPDVSTSDLNSAGVFDDAIQFGNTSSIDSYRFLISWCIALVTSWFVYYFIIGTLLFSGVLGCYYLPFLGGRPREIMLEKKELLKRNAASDVERGRNRPSIYVSK
jgi:hypothetical protein